jgi:hypothetical protein
VSGALVLTSLGLSLFPSENLKLSFDPIRQFFPGLTNGPYQLNVAITNTATDVDDIANVIAFHNGRGSLEVTVALMAAQFFPYSASTSHLG